MVLVLRSFYDKKLFQCIFFRICWRKSKIVTYGQNTYSLHALKELIYLKDQNFFNNPFQLLQWLHGKQQQQQKMLQPVGVCDGVDEAEGGAPGTTEHAPLLYNRL